ncbi:MAG: response regulator [Elusimicrobia bacterium]|nr:response regulator [Elusimicrobiota bacterium]
MRKKILAVDDDPAFIDFLRESLTLEGYEVLAAFNGEEAVRIASAEKPDVVLLDIMMPQMHGYEACERIRANEALAGTLIVILSAKNYQVDQVTAKAVGADHYLVKPFQFAELLALIRANGG